MREIKLISCKKYDKNLCRKYYNVLQRVICLYVHVFYLGRHSGLDDVNVHVIDKMNVNGQQQEKDFGHIN